MSSLALADESRVDVMPLAAINVFSSSSALTVPSNGTQQVGRRGPGHKSAEERRYAHGTGETVLRQGYHRREGGEQAPHGRGWLLCARVQ